MYSIYSAFEGSDRVKTLGEEKHTPIEYVTKHFKVSVQENPCRDEKTRS